MKGHEVYVIHPSLDKTAAAILNVASEIREWSDILFNGATFGTPSATKSPIFAVDDIHRPHSRQPSSQSTAGLNESGTLERRTLSSKKAVPGPDGSTNALIEQGTSQTNSIVPGAPVSKRLPPLPALTLPSSRTQSPQVQTMDVSDCVGNGHISFPPLSGSPTFSGISLTRPETAFSANQSLTDPALPSDPALMSRPKLVPEPEAMEHKRRPTGTKGLDNVTEPPCKRLRMDENNGQREVLKASSRLQAGNEPLTPSHAIDAVSNLATTPNFEPLIKTLLRERTCGRMSSSISTLETITRNLYPSALADIDMKDFRSYVVLAQAAKIVSFSAVKREGNHSWVSLRKPQQHSAALPRKSLPVASETVSKKTTRKAKIEYATEYFMRASSLSGSLCGAGVAPIFSKDGVTDLFERFVGLMRNLRRSSRNSGTGSKEEPPDMRAILGKKFVKDETALKTLIDSAKASGIVEEALGQGNILELELHSDF